MTRLWASFLMLLVLGLSSSAAAYSVKRTTVGTPVRWSVDHVGVQIDASLAREVGPRQARAALGIALDAWRGLGGPDLVLRPGLHEGDYRVAARGVQVIYASEWPHDPRLLAVTATTYDDTSGQILDADVLINPARSLELLEEADRYDTDDRDDDEEHGYDLGAVLTHEMGHVLGLGETDADPLATMWPRIGRGDTHQRSVEADDEAGVGEIYAAVQLAPSAGCGGARVASGPAHGVLPWLLVTLVAGLLGWLAWRRQNDQGVERRGARARVARSPAAAGLVFAGAVVALVVPSWTGRAHDDAPPGVRAARAFAAHRRPARERDAMLAAALHDEASSVRRAALLGILAEPRQSDAARVAHLLEDDDARVASLALEAWQHSVRAMPEDVAAADGRFEAFGDARPTYVHRTEIQTDDAGMLWTVCTLDEGELAVPGGCLHGVCQRYGEAPRPRAGDHLWVSAEASSAWAYREGTVAYGGWLEGGPAVHVPE